MTDLEHDLSVSLEWWTPNPYFEDDAEVDCEETAKNLTKMGYQRIVWHDAKKELPELNKYVSAYSEYVLGYDYYNQTYAVVSWNGTDWSDNNGIYYNIDYWAELPKINLEQ